MNKSKTNEQLARKIIDRAKKAGWEIRVARLEGQILALLPYTDFHLLMASEAARQLSFVDHPRREGKLTLDMYGIRFLPTDLTEMMVVVEPTPEDLRRVL